MGQKISGTRLETDSTLRVIDGRFLGSSYVIAVSPSGDTTGTADRAAFVTAHAAAAAAGGGVIELDDGTYYTNKSFTVTANNVHVRAKNRRQATIVAVGTWVVDSAPATGVVSFVGASNVSCTGLRVDSRTNNIQINGIVFVCTGADGAGTPVNGYVCHDNYISCRLGHHYHLWSLRAQNGKITSNEIDGGNTGYVSGGDSQSQEGIELFGASNVEVSGNLVYGIGNAGIFAFCQTVNVANSSVSDVLIFGNTVHSCRLGIYLDNSSSTLAGGGYLRNVRVLGNTVNKCWSSHVFVNSAGSDGYFENILIEGNTGLGATTAEGAQSDVAAIYLRRNSTGDALTLRGAFAVRGNTFTNIHRADSGGGRYILNWPAGATFESNTYAMVSTGSASTKAAITIGSTGWTERGETFIGARQCSHEVQTSTHFLMIGSSHRNFNQGAIGSSPIIINASCTDFVVDGVFLDTDTVTNLGFLVNLGGTGIRRFRIQGVRYQNANGNRGSLAQMLFNADLAWASSTAYAIGDVVRPTSGGSFYFECIVAGTSGGTEPTWPTGHGDTIVSGGATFIARSIWM